MFCERSRPTNKKNGEHKYITKKQASFVTSPALSTKMELFQIFCIHFDIKRGTEVVSDQMLWCKMYDLYILLSVAEYS